MSDTKLDLAKVATQLAELIDEAGKLNAETSRLATETAKINRQAKWYPAIASAVFIGGVVAAVKLFS
jgi:hypothetical protein